MLIAGAGGFARQVLSTLHASGIAESCVFYDDFSPVQIGVIPRYFKVLRSEQEAAAYFINDSRFVLATGNPRHRNGICNKLEALGGKVYTLVDPSVRISPYDIEIGEGATVLQDVVLEPGVQLGKGVLLNVRAIVTHDCIVGDFSEISPAAILLGSCQVGKYCMIGAGAVILPGIKVGNYAVIGAGAVVTADVGEGETKAGVPARLINKL